MITSDGVRLNVVTAGPDSPVTVVLLHGWTMDHTSWDPVVPALTDVRVVRPDFRGHGASGPAPRGSATIDRLADDVAELIAGLPGPIVLAGHSLGGMTMMALAERHPALVAERVAAAAFVATTSGGLSRLTFGLPRWVAAPILWAEKLLNRRIAKATSPTLLGRLHGTARPGVRWLVFGRSPSRKDIAATAAQVGRCNPANMVDFRNALNEHERVHALPAYRHAHTTVFAGGRDRLCSVADARIIADALPGADLLIYPSAGHMLTYECRDEVAQRLRGLVARVTEQAAVSA